MWIYWEGHITVIGNYEKDWGAPFGILQHFSK